MAIDALTRYPDRGLGDRAALDRLLDEEWTGTLSAVIDGAPWAVPMLHVRDGDRILLHGSTGAGLLRHAAAGAEVVLTVMQLRSLVVARTAFDHSADYVSTAIRGRLDVLEGDEKRAATATFTDGLLPGRSAELPEPTPKDLAATIMLALPIADGSWILKARTHGFAEPAGPRPDDDPTWAGVIPVHRVLGEPQPAPGNAAGVGMPDSVRALRGEVQDTR